MTRFAPDTRRFSKYGASKAPCRQGHIHDSIKEAARCNELHMLLAAHKIENLEIQKEFLLVPAIKYEKPMKSERKVSYIADFVYDDTETGKTIIEDTKGIKTKEYIIKRKLVKEKYCQDGKTIFIET